MFLSVICSSLSKSQSPNDLIKEVLSEPSKEEIDQALRISRQKDLSPKDVRMEDSMKLSNANTLYVLSHLVENRKHYGVVIVRALLPAEKLPVIVMATGGDGMHNQFNLTEDFNHGKVVFPELIGESVDRHFMIVVPSFRGQELIIGDKHYLSEGDVSDAFDGATTDALALLNVVLQKFEKADSKEIAVYGGSRGGTIALLASIRDPRISKAIVIAAPTDMNGLYHLYPEQFKLLFFNDLLTGKITKKEARIKFISSSPGYFVKELPPIQLHHDNADPFVPVGFAKNFERQVKKIGKLIEVYYYDKGLHGYWPDDIFAGRVRAFLSR